VREKRRRWKGDTDMWIPWERWLAVSKCHQSYSTQSLLQTKKLGWIHSSQPNTKWIGPIPENMNGTIPSHIIPKLKRYGCCMKIKFSQTESMFSFRTKTWNLKKIIQE
jgi:hypothetical protein